MSDIDRRRIMALAAALSAMPGRRALRSINYRGRVSIECASKEFAKDALPAISALQRQIGDKE